MTSSSHLSPLRADGGTLTWAVHLTLSDRPGDREALDRLADKVARAARLDNHGQIGELAGHYLFADSVRSSIESSLTEHEGVRWHSEQKLLKRSKRGLQFSDPKYPLQWHLHNRKRVGMDINVTGVWERNVTGRNVTVVVVDDGVEHTVPDIQENYVRDCLSAHMLNMSIIHLMYIIEPSSSVVRALTSWGPDDDGKTVDGPHPLGKVALQHGVMAGRRGFGSIFVVASGNGGQYEDNCNYDGYANSIYTVTIGAVDEEGRMPFYAEECASMLAVTFSSGDKMMRSIVIVGSSHRTSGLGITQSKLTSNAALGVGVGEVACWRCHHLDDMLTHLPDLLLINGAGLSHSHKHGFGLLNAWRLVNAAKIWESVPYLTSYSSPVQKEGKDIPLHPKVLEVVWNVTAEDLNLSGMKTLEHVAVTLTITHPARGKLEIKLFCPSGMSSLIGAKRVVDTDASGFNDWMFSTVRCWGERAEGIYKLTDSQQKRGSLKKSQLVLYGSSWSFEDVQQRRRLVEGAMSGQFLNDSFSLPCPLGLEISDQESTVMAPNTLKMLLLLGCFAVFWSIYYTLEVIYTRKTFEFSMWCNRYPCEQYSSLHSEELNKCTSELQPLQAPTSGQDPGDQWPLTVDGDHRVGDHRPLRCPATTGTDSVHLTSRQPAERVGPTQTPGVTGNIPRGTLLFALEDETT
uniref:Proprotein convertase subtilisin/kexin type 7 n=1 Tax=Callorhinchus milii TaxID=7868 RepID=A0A4W3HPE4_CALMI